MGSTHHTTRVTGAVLAVALFGFAAGMGAPASASAGANEEGAKAPASFLPELADSATLTSPPVVEGRVLDRSQRPVSGAELVLYAWPSDEVMSTLVPGDRVKLLPVGKARSDAAGGYRLRIDDAGRLRPSQARDGVVNLEAVSYSSAGVGVHAFPVRLVEGDRRDKPRLANQDTRGSTFTTAKADLIADRSATRDSSASDTAVAEQGVVDKSCTSALQANLGVAWSLVGQLYITATGVKGQFTYLNGASSTLGVGTSSSGKFGTFTPAGTSTRSSTLSITYPQLSGAGNKYYDTQFTFGKYVVTCYSTTGTLTIRYEVRATSFAGGSRVRSLSSAPKATYCTPYNAGSVVEKTTTKAVTWTNGVDISSTIGIDLSVSTGYSTTAKLRYTFSSRRQLCGVTGYPGSTPSQLVAKA